MEFNSSYAQQWLKNTEIYLPEFPSVIANCKSEILLIGAAVLQNYEIQKWIPPVRRSTGDLDISIGITTSENEYQELKNLLLLAGYTQNNDHPYRLHSPIKIPNSYTYIDILAHSASQNASESLAQKAMGVGDGFNLEGMSFAQKHMHPITNNLFIPNIFAFLNLKKISYLDNPTKRTKDLADIVECTTGLVQNGCHFEMSELWAQVKSEKEAQQIMHVLRTLGKNQSAQWDIEEVRNELAKRGYSNEDIDEVLLEQVLDFVQEIVG